MITLAVSGWLWAAATSTTVLNVHQGAVLPEARVVVIAVPSIILLGYLWLVVRRRGRGPKRAGPREPGAAPEARNG